jgi:hypothetical protein
VVPQDKDSKRIIAADSFRKSKMSLEEEELKNEKLNDLTKSGKK